MQRQFVVCAAAALAFLLLSGANPSQAQFTAVSAAEVDPSTVDVVFSAAVDPATGGTAGNYQVTEDRVGGARILVTAAVASGDTVRVTLQSSMLPATEYLVRVQNVQDTGGNTVPPGGSVTIDRPDVFPPTIVSAEADVETEVVVVYSEAVTPATGSDTGNYQVFETSTPANTVGVGSVALSAGNTTATLTLSGTLAEDVDYTVQIDNVEDVAGNAIDPGSSSQFTFSTGVVTIAAIQENISTFNEQQVTVEGQVFIRPDYRRDGSFTNWSGYMQDGSGRGINIFGFSDDAFLSSPALNDPTNVLRMTGTVELFNTTVEIAGISALQVVGTAPALTPQILGTTNAANSPDFEGTFIQVTGTVQSSEAGGPGRNYTVDDGSGAILVRVVDTLGLGIIPDGTEISARGAGGNFQGTFQLLVGAAEDVFEPGGDTIPPGISSVGSADAGQVTATFTEAVTPATAENVANYAFFEASSPSNTLNITSVSLGGDGRTVTLALAVNMAEGVNYSLQVNNVQDLAGNTIAANTTSSFVFSTTGVTPISVIQENVSTFENTEVTIQGQMYIRPDHRQPDTSINSGYLQDDSGRGINIFGFGDDPFLTLDVVNDPTNVLRITGTIELFNTTVEVAGITALEVVGTAPPPQPTPVSTFAANDSRWEGTFILVSGEIVAGPTSAGPGVNYTINDGSGPFIVRVVDTLNAPTFTVGTTIWARGAGSAFGSDFQVSVGVAADITDQDPGDTFPPSVLRASATAPREVTVQFNEAVEMASATNTANYEVFRVSAPATTLDVTSATMGEGTSQVILSLGDDLDVGLGWNLRVSNVADLSGNTIRSSGVVSLIEAPILDELDLDGPAFTFLPRLGEQYPITVSVPRSVTEGSVADDVIITAEVLLRVFDTSGRLKRTLVDSRFISPESFFQDQRAVVPWNGRDEESQIVPAGTYVVHLLVTDPATGRTQQRQMPVVVATRLER